MFQFMVALGLILVACVVAEKSDIGSRDGSVSTERSKRLIGGMEASEEEKAHVASLRGKVKGHFFTNTYKYCASSIISKSCVLTAADCIGDLQNADKWEVRIGSKYLGATVGQKAMKWIKDVVGASTQWHKIKKIFFSKKSAKTGAADSTENKMLTDNQTEEAGTAKDGAVLWSGGSGLAILKLKPKIKQWVKNIRRIEVPPAKERMGWKSISWKKGEWPKTGQKCAVTGWGCQKSGKDSRKEEISRMAVLSKLDNSKCNQTRAINTAMEFCAGFSDDDDMHIRNVGICNGQGDIGGPLICKNNGTWYQAGVASYASQVASDKKPSIFIRVSAYTDWIRKTCPDV